MYLIKTVNGDKIVSTANEVKTLDKNKITKIYSLVEVDYDLLISTSDIRDYIYTHLKGTQMEKETFIAEAAESLDVKKNEVSKVITAMKKEGIIYVVKDFGWIGIN